METFLRVCGRGANLTTMDRFMLVLTFALLYCQVSYTIIMPLKKPDGSIDLNSMLNHLTLFEQTVTTLQQSVEAFKLTQNAETAVLKTEISNLKAHLKLTAPKILDLQKQSGQISAEMTSLKDEVTAAKTEVSLVSNQVISLTSKFNNLNQSYKSFSSRVNSTVASRDAEQKALDQKYQTLSSQVNSTSAARDAELRALDQKYQTLSSQVNYTGATRDAELKALDQKYQTLSSQVNSTGATRDVELKALDQKYQTLSSQVNSTGAARDVELKALDQKYQTLSSQVNSTGAASDAELKALDQKYQTLSSRVNSIIKENTTKTLHAVQNVLSGVLSEVHSAQHDRVLLHGYLTKLNHAVSALDATSKATSIQISSLSATIARRDTYVMFESWMGSSPVGVSDNVLLKFSDIQSNVGGGYNAGTGVFRAPVSGTYLFYTQVEKTGDNIFLVMHKGSREIGTAYTSYDYHVTQTVIALARVTAGEEIYVVETGANTIQCCQKSKFGGILLYKY